MSLIGCRRPPLLGSVVAIAAFSLTATRSTATRGVIRFVCGGHLAVDVVEPELAQPLADAPRADGLVMAPDTGSPYSGIIGRESTQFGVKTCSLGGGLAPD